MRPSVLVEFDVSHNGENCHVIVVEGFIFREITADASVVVLTEVGRTVWQVVAPNARQVKVLNVALVKMTVIFPSSELAICQQVARTITSDLERITNQRVALIM